MLKVAIIDDGIGTGLYNLGNISRNIEITSELEIQDKKYTNLFNNSHGTICAAIVKKYYPEALLFSIQILSNKSCKGTKEQLVKAIEWCIYNKIKVVNLSLGTTNFKDFEFIRNMINIAYSKGVIIIAACSNKNIFTYPAACNNVIGVKTSITNKLQEGEYLFNLYPLDGIEIIACSEHILSKNGNKSGITKACNSYAAPMITAKVCKIIEEYPNATLEEIKLELYKSSINYLDSTIRVNNYKNIDWISNAAALNMNKSIFSQAFHLDQIPIFEEIKDIDFKLFDTIIILNSCKGNFRETLDIISKVESEQKNIVLIDDEFKDENYKIKYPNDNIKFWTPSIINNFFEELIPTSDREVPLIIVYDYTENNLTKIVSTLVSKFRSDGYYALGACTKSIGVLYGLEYILFDKKENLQNLKTKIEMLYEIYEYDIIVLGIGVNQDDDNLIKKINICLDPDKVIFYADKFQNKPSSINDDLFIESNKDINLLYKKVLNMFLYENQRV